MKETNHMCSLCIFGANIPTTDCDDCKYNTKNKGVHEEFLKNNWVPKINITREVTTQALEYFDNEFDMFWEEYHQHVFDKIDYIQEFVRGCTGFTIPDVTPEEEFINFITDIMNYYNLPKISLEEWRQALVHTELLQRQNIKNIRITFRNIIIGIWRYTE